ncbi:MAG TPA: diguanylate cyclase [Stellaceae bacterium]|nr:diguanylate cyclase [Stellaceae bacterium]
MRFGIVAIVICGIAALAARFLVNEWVHEAKSLTRRQELISAQLTGLRNFQDALLDLETGERGYLITGDEAYLEPASASRRDLDAAANQLEVLFRDEPENLAKLHRIVKVGRVREQQLAGTIKLRREEGFAAALVHVQTNEGERTMGEFRGLAKSLVEQLGAARSAAATQEMSRYRDLSKLDAALVVLILLLVSAAVGLLVRAIYRLDQLQRLREREAMHDALTGLPNRRYLGEWLNLTLAAAQRSGQPLVLLYFDLDGFKAVNDRFGHDAGDRVLQATAARLTHSVRTSDFVARLGGDEFVAALPAPPPPSDLAALIERLQQTLAEAPIPQLRPGAVSASIGVAWYPQDGGTVDELLAAGDRFMYEAKEHRRAENDRGAAADARFAAG